MTEETLKKAIIVSIAKSSSELFECEKSLDELERLLETAGAYAVARVIQIKENFMTNVRPIVIRSIKLYT